MQTPQSSFFTRPRANEGIEVPLSLPDGTPTEHKLRILGVDSDVFRTEEAASRQRMLEAASSKEGIAKFDHQAERVRLVSYLVGSWSFEQPCTPENVQAFLRDAPQIMEAIDKVAANRRAFFKVSSSSSSDTPSASSS